MIPNRDHYADKNGNLTEDPNEFARQIGVKGCFLDDRIANRYGITDVLVSTDEPRASRRVTGRNEGSVKVKEAAESAIEPQPQEPQEPADAVAAEKPAAKKEKK